MDRLMDIAGKHDLTVLEDGCQAMGAGYKGKKLGAIGDAGAFSMNIYKTLTTGEGGIITTNNRTIYERAYGYHDQGFSPLRKEKGAGNWTLVGINLKMNELTAAFMLGQLSKMDRILVSLREKKKKFRDHLLNAGLKNIEFERLNDPDEGHMIITVRFNDAGIALRAAEALGTITLSQSGWHVYNNMQQVHSYVYLDGDKPIKKHVLPYTDDILARSINFSIGVINPGLGSGTGISILSSDREIKEKAEGIVRILKTIIV
jgi:8-amino-3,8-dideoxy-alpha-D-manno-octulosonate transaminase